MKRVTQSWLLLLAAALGAAPGWAMELAWTRTTGQYRVEAAPSLVDSNDDGAVELLAVNLGGQVMLWNVDGGDMGAGQDGAVAQLPDGRWTSSPSAMGSGSKAQYLFGSVEGLLVALNNDFTQAWTYQLPDETTWSRAVPVILETKDGPAWCIADRSGTITCLDSAGGVRWAMKLDEGPCLTIAQTFALDDGSPALLVPAGNVLCCLDTAGTVLWRRDLGGQMLARPEVLSLGEKRLIVCGAGAGSLFGLNLQGEVLWQTAIGEDMDATIAFLPREDGQPLILCAGLWGNLYAFDAEGRPLWTHVYRAKTRARPLVLDADGDGDKEIVVATYRQKAYVFSHDGELVDELRVSSGMNAFPLALPVEAGAESLLLVSSALVAHRFNPGPPAPIYGAAPQAKGVTAAFSGGEPPCVPASLLVDNPSGALLSVNSGTVDEAGRRLIRGQVSARSRIEVSLPKTPRDAAAKWFAVVRDPNGSILAERTAPIAAPPDAGPPRTRVWSTPAYATFDDTCLHPCRCLDEPDEEQGVVVGPVYEGEVGQGALVIASSEETSLRARVSIQKPAREDGTLFAGGLLLREVVMTGTVNGERVGDALPALGPAGLVTIPPARAAKVWVSVDARGAEPGDYRGSLTVHPLHKEFDEVELDLTIRVADIEMPRRFPLTVCTWDYLPNNWFAERIPRILDDMGRHGVNVFPRSSIPSAEMDANGRLAMDWTKLDAELERLDGRGTILFQISQPLITLPKTVGADERRRLQIEYLHAFRDYLGKRGWTYDRYAFYPTDEPGLHYGERVPALADAAGLFREADPRFRVYTDPVPGLSWKDFQRVEPLVDVWCPNMRLVTGLLVDDPRIERIMASGKPVWSYECVAQVKSLSPLRYNRANAWRAYYFGLDGIGHWTYSTTSVNQWYPGTTTDDEYALVYPGTMPVPSVRWEAVRDGLEDVAALMLLSEHIETSRGIDGKRALVAQAEAELRIACTDMMELSDEAFVESRDFLKEGDRRIWHTREDVRMLQAHRTRIAALTLALGE